MAAPVAPEKLLCWIELPPLSYWAESDASLTFQLRLSCTFVRRIRLWSPRSSMLLPLNDSGSSLNPQSLSSIRLWCAFSFTSKHSPPKVLIVELRTTMPLLVSLA